MSESKSFIEDVYEPLQQYTNVFKSRFEEVCEATFKELASASQVDVEANRALCAEIRKLEASAKDISKQLSVKIWLCVLLWIAAAASLGWGIYNLAQFSILPLTGGLTIGGLLIVILLLFKIHPDIRKLKASKKDIIEIIELKKHEAWQQMSPLNKLYDWDILTRMMTQTVPRLEFDPYVTNQRLDELRENYGWDDAFNNDRSVICSYSGTINGNPFAICSTRTMQWTTKRYEGHRTIYWTTTERDANGKLVTRTHSQTLVAYHDAPYPDYSVDSRLIYGNPAAPDLIFSRQVSNLANKKDSHRYRSTLRHLQRQSQKLDNFVLANNEDFEICFDTRNRNNDQQFRLLFTPLAQQNILSLLRDQTEGYGDDFSFLKHRMINTIMAAHLETMPLELSPDLYHSYDFDQAEENFKRTNAEYFRSIYFTFAPLLSIPLYQQTRSQSSIYANQPKKSSFWEHEVWANFWGEQRFRHPECATDCILKTTQTNTSDGNINIGVTAHGHKTIPHITTKSVMGGDGKFHSVPVEWYEYIPVTGRGSFLLQEDKTDDTNLQSVERRSHIDNMETQMGEGSIYRRHIASKLHPSY